MTQTDCDMGVHHACACIAEKVREAARILEAAGGTCGERLEPIDAVSDVVGGGEALHCELPAGHAGAHRCGPTSWQDVLADQLVAQAAGGGRPVASAQRVPDTTEPSASSDARSQDAPPPADQADPDSSKSLEQEPVRVVLAKPPEGHDNRYWRELTPAADTGEMVAVGWEVETFAPLPELERYRGEASVRASRAVDKNIEIATWRGQLDSAEAELAREREKVERLVVREAKLTDTLEEINRRLAEVKADVPPRVDREALVEWIARGIANDETGTQVTEDDRRNARRIASFAALSPPLRVAEPSEDTLGGVALAIAHAVSPVCLTDAQALDAARAAIRSYRVDGAPSDNPEPPWCGECGLRLSDGMPLSVHTGHIHKPISHDLMVAVTNAWAVACAMEDEAVEARAKSMLDKAGITPEACRMVVRHELGSTTPPSPERPEWPGLREKVRGRLARIESGDYSVIEMCADLEKLANHPVWEQAERAAVEAEQADPGFTDSGHATGVHLPEEADASSTGDGERIAELEELLRLEREVTANYRSAAKSRGESISAFQGANADLLAVLRDELLRICAQVADGSTASAATTGDPAFALGEIDEIAKRALKRLSGHRGAEGEAAVCPVCEGSGHVGDDVAVKPGPCPRCGGAGTLPAASTGDES